MKMGHKIEYGIAETKSSHFYILHLGKKKPSHKGE
jgi:hypothetical protein